MGGIGSVLTTYHKNIDEAQDTLELCTGCGYCTSICPSKIDTPNMVLELRTRLAKSHGIPLAGKIPIAMLKHPEFMQNMIRMARVFQPAFMNKDGTIIDLPFISNLAGAKKMPGLAPKLLREILPERSGAGNMKVSLYAGCMLDFIYPKIGEAIWDVSSANDVTTLFPKDQCCCGAPALYMCDQDSAIKLATDNIIALENGSPDYVITGCPTCAMMLKERFPILLKDTEWQERAAKLSSKVMDFSQFTADVLNIQVGKSKDRKVTYHDPCHQVRGLKTSQYPRDLINRAGMEIIEMEDSDECCGFAGSYSIKQPGISASIMNRKIEHIEATGAQILATDCPGCIMQIRGGLLKRGGGVQVCHTAELIASMLE
jgi:Fe-S oxidoreductase